MADNMRAGERIFLISSYSDCLSDFRILNSDS